VQKNIVKIIVTFLIVSVLISNISLPFSAENLAENLAITNTYSQKSDLREYNQYLKECGINKKADNTVELPINNFIPNKADVVYQNNILHWNEGKGEITFNVKMQEARLYNLQIVWKPSKQGVDVELGLKIDGKYQFEGSDMIELSRMWENISDKPRIDSFGNEYAQEQKETEGFITECFRDKTGAVVEPYMIALSEGSHTITLVNPNQSIQISRISLVAPERVKSYAEASKSYKIEDNNAEIIIIQGENAHLKSSASMIPKSNNSDAGMTPSDSKITKINYIGGTSWQSPCDTMIWNFEVEKSGYYKLDLRYKQSDLVNGESWRWLKIDGKTPFEEAKALRFPYGTGWKYFELGNEYTPYYIWLDEGKHTLSLEVTTGEQSEYFAKLSDIVDILGDEYIKIVMITGEVPDVNRDYELFKQIPDFNNTLSHCSESIKSLVSEMKEATGKNSTQAIAAMENMARILDLMVKNPYIAQQYVKDYYNNYTSVSAWLYDMTDMPLAIDEIQLVPAGKQYIDKNAGFFKKLYYGAMRLITSFADDYQTNASERNGEKTIRLWVNWGQDQTAVLNSLIKDSFTPETNINVKLEIVSASLVNGILAGNFPDLSLHMARTEPVNLGMRGALYDLTQFEDYEDVLKRFQPNAETPYRYNDKLYALPDTQTFFLMFYRTDVLEKLGIQVPKTWDEFLYASTIIQRNNMNVYVPYTQITTSTTVNAGIGNLHLFPTLLAQNDLSIYNSNQNGTELRDDNAIDIFEYWTEFYTDYGFLKEADFYNRFRIGVMPLGIAPYSMYMNIYSTAPEIKGRWSVTTVPGSSDGSQAIAGGGTGCAIIEKSDNKEEAWEFLKWWTSSETQSRYSMNVESILGMIGRVTTANVEALSKLSWENNDLDVILEQWSYVEEIPEIPGSYYLTRALDQAFWAVVNGDSNARDALNKWSRVADDEIVRKLKEYS